MTGKVIFQAVLSIIAGIAFITIGIYFLSSRFLNKINEASSIQSEEVFKKNAFRAKGSGYITLALGALTLVMALLLFTFPIAASWISLVYLFFIMIAVMVLVFVFK
ncbi:MAG: hypothetical protein K5681_07435 [Treponema sp.]|nr:hypothetical protein [Treponema sp.]